jgi:predicted transposase/invertase (TIGR01784 family)
MKTDSFFYRFFREYRSAFFEMIGQGRQKARRYKFASVEVKELAFRFDGIFLPEFRADDVYFVEVQFQKKRRFYPRFLAEIFVYLAQFKTTNDWRGVAIFPTRAIDPGVPRHYRELFEHGRVLRVYLDELPEEYLQKFPMNLLQLILDRQQNVLATVAKIARRMPAEMPEARAQDKFIELLVNLLLNKFPTLSRIEVEKMVEPLFSNVKKSRFYRELKEETAQELTPKIAQELTPKIAQELTPKIAQESKREIAKELALRKMSLEFIVEVTRLSPREVRAIMKELAARKKPV